MSLQTFQSGMLRLITDPEFRDRVIAEGEPALRALDLTARECLRLQTIAADRGLDINRTLHKGFRLGKLRALLPLTCQLLGTRHLAREVSGFWKQTPPASFSFIPDALAFCTWLMRRKPRIRYLSEVLAYERAMLELERARHEDATADPPTQTVHFHHDPAQLLGALGAGRRPRAIPACDCRAIGSRDRHGHIRWQIHATHQT